MARLLNSSCDPNCQTQKWHDAATGEPRVGIFAQRDILPGEELTYDYFFQVRTSNVILCDQCEMGPFWISCTSRQYHPTVPLSSTTRQYCSGLCTSRLFDPH